MSANSHRFFANKECEYYPCHTGIEEQNCLFCYCPLFGIEKCPGNPSFVVFEGRKRKDCTNCTFPHKPENYEKVMELLR